jgi:hypothetical protein
LTQSQFARRDHARSTIRLFEMMIQSLKNHPNRWKVVITPAVEPQSPSISDDENDTDSMTDGENESMSDE